MNDFIEFDLEDLSEDEWLALLADGAAEEPSSWEGDVDLWDHDSWPDPPF